MAKTKTRKTKRAGKTTGFNQMLDLLTDRKPRRAPATKAASIKKVGKKVLGKRPASGKRATRGARKPS